MKSSLVLCLLLLQLTSNSSAAPGPRVVISQIYGGGGNSGAPYTHDFVELFNSGDQAASLAGWSLQYAAATGTTVWSKTDLSGSIPAGGYFLVQFSGGSTGSALPLPDQIGTTTLAATAGKVALVSNTIALNGACPAEAAIADLVGYGTTANCVEGSGPAPAPGNATSVARGSAGCQDTNINAADFATQAPNPRNSSSSINRCPVAPAIECPGNHLVVLSAGTAEAEVSLSAIASGYPMPEISYWIGDTQVVFPYYFELGDTLVIARAGSAECTFTVSVHAQPEIACPTMIDRFVAGGEESAECEFAAVATGFPAPILTYSVNGQAVESPFAFPLGETSVLTRAENLHGVTECEFTVRTLSEDRWVEINAPASGTLVSVGTPLCFKAASFGLGEPVHYTWQFQPESLPHVQALPDQDGCTSLIRFLQPGLYAFACGASGEAVELTTNVIQADPDQPAFIIVYDPSAGFVTGGGHIYSPPGAFAWAPEAEGRASFGFVARYRKGATIPDGNTEFIFNAGGLSFKSLGYQWLVVSGARAQFKGWGSINGEGHYEFMATAVDGQTAGNRDDRFRMKISEIGGGLIYDNNDEATLLGGSIVIHRK